MIRALLVASAIAVAAIGMASPASADRDQRSYQIGYESAQAGAVGLLAGFGVSHDELCEKSLTSVYMFQDEGFSLNEQDFRQGCLDALDAEYGPH